MILSYLISCSIVPYCYPASICHSLGQVQVCIVLADINIKLVKSIVCTIFTVFGAKYLCQNKLLIPSLSPSLPSSLPLSLPPLFLSPPLVFPSSQEHQTGLMNDSAHHPQLYVEETLHLLDVREFMDYNNCSSCLCCGVCVYMTHVD